MADFDPEWLESNPLFQQWLSERCNAIICSTNPAPNVVQWKLIQQIVLNTSNTLECTPCITTTRPQLQQAPKVLHGNASPQSITITTIRTTHGVPWTPKDFPLTPQKPIAYPTDAPFLELGLPIPSVETIQLKQTSANETHNSSNFNNIQ